MILAAGADESGVPSTTPVTTPCHNRHHNSNSNSSTHAGIMEMAEVSVEGTSVAHQQNRACHWRTNRAGMRSTEGSLS